MYIHYARTTNQVGTKLVQLLFCSGDRGRYNITKQTNEFYISKYDWQQYCIPVVSMLKQIPSSQRSYDQPNKVWTILETKWNTLIEIFRALNFEFKCYNNLYVDCVDKDWDGRKTAYEKVVIDPTEFFYENADERGTLSSPSDLTIEQIEESLRELLSITKDVTFSIITESDLKKFYRKAAMKFHPDLNGGDASKMTELNYYWQQYNQLKTKVSA